MTPFCKQVRLRAVRYRWFLCLVSRPCTYALVKKSSWYSIINNIKDKLYWLGTVRILSFLNRFLHEYLGPIPDIILITLFCSLNICCAILRFDLLMAVNVQDYGFLTCNAVQLTYKVHTFPPYCFKSVYAQMLLWVRHMKMVVELSTSTVVVFWAWH